MILIPGEKYKLKNSGSFCHAYTSEKGKLENIIHSNKIIDVIFVGQVNTTSGTRNIFYSDEYVGYIMYSTDGVSSYILNERQTEIEEIKRQIEVLQDRIKKLSNGKS